MQKNIQATILKLFAGCAVIMELVIFFNAEEFDQVSYGWMIEGGLIFCLMGIALLSIMVAQVLEKKAK